LSLRRTLNRNLSIEAVSAVVIFGFACFLIAAGCKTAPTQRQPTQQLQVTTLVKQLSTLRQSDLIVFPDGRVWYVRDVHSGSMEVVGWIGDNAKSEDINSFALTDHDFTIVRQNDPKWAYYRDKYFKQ
jgi:hypothetical protein